MFAWSQRCAHSGYRSCEAVPLRCQGKCNLVQCLARLQRVPFSGLVLPESLEFAGLSAMSKRAISLKTVFSTMYLKRRKFGTPTAILLRSGNRRGVLATLAQSMLCARRFLGVPGCSSNCMVSKHCSVDVCIGCTWYHVHMILGGVQAPRW